MTRSTIAASLATISVAWPPSSCTVGRPSAHPSAAQRRLLQAQAGAIEALSARLEQVEAMDAIDWRNRIAPERTRTCSVARLRS